jgi:hypothetical protein
VNARARRSARAAASADAPRIGCGAAALYNNGVIARSAVVLSALALVAACSSDRTERPAPNVEDRAAAARPDEAPESTAHDRISTSTPGHADWFTDRAVETGLDFVHFNGA